MEIVLPKLMCLAVVYVAVDLMIECVEKKRRSKRKGKERESKKWEKCLKPPSKTSRAHSRIQCSVDAEGNLMVSTVA